MKHLRNIHNKSQCKKMTWLEFKEYMEEEQQKEVDWLLIFMGISIRNIYMNINLR